MGALTRTVTRKTTRKVTHTVTGRGTSTPIVPLNPSQVANNALWLDASDGASITSAANAVSQWNDKSGNNNHATQAVGASQPITGTRTVNALNGIDFNGTTHNMGLTTPILASGIYTAFYVMKFDTFAANATVVGGLVNSAVFGAQTTNSRIAKAGVANVLVGTITLSGVNPTFFTAKTTDLNSTTYLSGVLDASGSASASYTAGMSTIGMHSGSNFLDGILCEVALFTRFLTNAEINSIGTYLTAKWGGSWTALP